MTRSMVNNGVNAVNPVNGANGAVKIPPPNGYTVTPVTPAPVQSTMKVEVEEEGPPPPPPPGPSGFSLAPPPPPTSDQGYSFAPPPPPPGYSGYGTGSGNDGMSGDGVGYAIEYRCKPCHLLFNTKHELIRHKRSMHPEAANKTPSTRGRGRGKSNGSANGRAPRFHCNICNRSFSGKQHFEYHMRTHTGEKPFSCPTCGKAFRAKHSLKNHIRIHTGERPYQCKQCGKWFRQLGVMKNHIKNMHSNPLHHDIPGQHRAAMAPPNAPP